MKIYLIRHGETTSDLEDRYGGSYDDHLTERGKQQLQRTATGLLGKGVETIFSSSLIRAKESAEIIREKIGAPPVEIMSGLRERHYGVLTGLTKKEATEKYPEVVERHKNSKNTDPDGESFDDFNQRVIDAFESLKSRNNKIIAVVSHGGPIKAIHRHIGQEVNRQLGDGEILELDV